MTFEQKYRAKLAKYCPHMTAEQVEAEVLKLHESVKSNRENLARLRVDDPLAYFKQVYVDPTIMMFLALCSLVLVCLAAYKFTAVFVVFCLCLCVITVCAYEENRRGTS